jgi:transglutaminase-like putative cysteine protease
MKAAFVCYTLLLLLEGSLAWLLTGQGFLLVAISVGLVIYASLYQAPRPVTETVRLLTAAALAVAGPLQYQAGLEALMLCFIAVPHFLAASQALAEQRQEANRESPPRPRSLVFTIAFYASMGLVFLLARGLEPGLERLTSAALATLVLPVALAAWQASRIPRLRSALPARPASLRPWLVPAVLSGLAMLLFSGPLPWAAQMLCRLSPHWRMDPVEFKNKPPKPPPSQTAAKPSDEATRTGTDESSVTGEHHLPPRSNLQASDAPRFYIKTAAAADLLSRGPVYLRSHTLNHFSDNKWTAQVSGGVWLEDARDGTVDGRIILNPSPKQPAITHEVFALEADGYTLPALPGLTEIHLPRIYAVPGDVLQTQATGDIRYRAVSAPVFYDALPAPALLEAAMPEDQVHLRAADAELGIQLQRLAGSIFGSRTLLSDRVTALREFLARHYQYSTVMQNPRDLPALENFLFEERRGHCDFYATAAALLLREGGVPTRIAYGFASQEMDPDTGLILVRDRHAHAWTELYLKEYGWTLCDFTPVENVGRPSAPTESPPVPAPDLTAFADAAREAPPPPPQAVEADLPAFARLLTWMQQQQWLSQTMKQAPLLLLGAALVIGLIRLWRRQSDPVAAEAKARAALDRQPAYYVEFLRVSAAAGHPKPEGRTPWEHFRDLITAGLPVDPLRGLIEYHCATRYEDVPPDPSREQGFMATLKSFAAAVTATPR